MSEYDPIIGIPIGGYRKEGAAMSDIVHRLKAQGGKNYGLYAEAASTIEALRGEVARLRSTFNAGTVEQILKVTQVRAEKAEAEVALLKAERDGWSKQPMQLFDRVATLTATLNYLKVQAENGTLHNQVVIQNCRKALAGETT